MSGAASYRPETLAVRAGQERSQFGEHAEALYLTSSFVFKSAAQAAKRFSGEEEGNVYARFSNPTVTMFEERLAERSLVSQAEAPDRFCEVEALAEHVGAEVSERAIANEVPRAHEARDGRPLLRDHDLVTNADAGEPLGQALPDLRNVDLDGHPENVPASWSRSRLR